MAKTARPRTGPRTGGRLALFEVLQAQQEPDDAPASPSAVTPATSTATPQTSPATAPAAMPTFAASRPVPAGGSPSTSTGMSGVQVGGVAIGLLCLALVGGAFAFGRISAGGGGDEQPAAELVPEALAVGREGRPQQRPPAASVLDTSTAQIQARRPAAAPAGPVRRVSGTNYVLVQSYAKSEADRAEATVEALRAAGIGATIETDIKGWPNKLCVFGTEPFERVRKNEAYNAYLARVKAVGESNTDRKIKRFAPTPVQWGR